MIKSVVKAIEILRVLSDADGKSLSLAEISTATGYNKSTCVHLLETLVAENMAEHVSRSEGYSIGYGAFMLSRFGGFNHRLRSVTHPVLKWLNAKTGQTVIFCVLKGDKRVCIDSVLGEYLLGSGENIRVEDLPRASTGIVLIANMPETVRREFFCKYREIAESMVDDPEELERSLAEVKGQGYGENSLMIDGVKMRGFAVPVFKGEECIGAIGIPYRGEREPVYLKYLKTAAKEITHRLEFYDYE